MKTSSTHFLKVHIASVLILFGGAFLFVTGMDPHRIFEYSWSQAGPRHQNVTLQKYEMMESFAGAQAVIFGSSTSENYLPVDVEALTGFKTFHAAVPGSQALARTALLKKAVQQYPDLKLAILVEDFYESNDNADLLFNHKVLRNSKLRSLIPNDVLKVLPFQIKQYFWDVFSNQSFEAAFAQIRIQSGSKRQEYYRKNGTVSTIKEIAASPVSFDGTAAGISDGLRQKIDQNWLQYKSNALKDYAFSERVVKVYESILSEVSGGEVAGGSDGAKILIILSPLHPRFYEKLKAEPGLLAGYSLWRSFMLGLSKYRNVIVYDPMAMGLNLPLNEPYWRDGVHYNQDVSALILEYAVKMANVNLY